MGVLSLNFFTSCNNVAGENESEKVIVKQPENTLEEKKAAYNTLVGTSWIREQYSDRYGSIVFKASSIILDDIEYSLNLDKDLYFFDELPEDYKNSCEYASASKDALVWCRFNDNYYGMVTPFNGKPGTLSMGYTEKPEKIIDFNGMQIKDLGFSDFILVSSGTGGGDQESSSGTYTFNSASGSQSNGAVTLTDGQFTYSGSKTTAPSSGTYTVNGSDITFSWTAGGYSAQTTVTLTRSGSSVTFSSSEVLFFSTFFGSTAQSGGKYSLTFEYSQQ